MDLVFSKEEAIDIVTDNHDDFTCVEETIQDQSRWNTYFKGIFINNKTNKHYSVIYGRGSTECQESELFYTDEVIFTEVELKEVITKEWVKVE